MKEARPRAGAFMPRRTKLQAYAPASRGEPASQDTPQQAGHP